MLLSVKIWQQYPIWKNTCGLIFDTIFKQLTNVWQTSTTTDLY